MEINSQEVQDKSQLTPKILSKLDELQFGRWHFFVVMALGLVWVFDGYEVTLVSLYRHQIQDQTSVAVFKSLASAYQIGSIVGSVFFGIMAFLIGRQKIFIITLVIYFFGVLLSGVLTTVPLFVFSRFLTGLSVGGQFTAIFTAVDEFMPPSYRGRVNIGIDGTWHFGATLASLLTMLVGQTEHWRVMFLVGWVGIVALIVMRRNVPESPRWLISKGRIGEAEVIINAIVKAVSGKRFLLEEVEPDELDSERGNVHNQIQVYNHTFCGYFMQIIRLVRDGLTKHTKKFIVSFILIFTQAVFFNMIYYQYPDTLASKYHLQQSQISAYMMPISIICFISACSMGQFFDKIGRRVLLLITYSTTGVLLLFSYSVDDLMTKEVIICVMFIFASPAGSSANLIASQVFPTASRTIMLSVMFMVSMTGGVVGIWFDHYIVVSVIMILAGIIAFLFCPNAENKTLEQIQKL